MVLKNRASLWLGAWCLLLVGGVTGCEDQEVPTTTRNLNRPGPLALACAARVGDAGVTVGLSLEHCTPAAGKQDGGATTAPLTRGTLYGFVANTAKGEVALFRPAASGEPLVDLDRGSPGFGFIPVGSLPTDLETSRDGCRLVSANSGSCDLSIIDVPAVLGVAAGELSRPHGGSVSRVFPRTASGQLLRARPQEVALVPSSVQDKGEGLCPSAGQPPVDAGGDAAASDAGAASGPGRYRAYVTFPRCNLLAEIDLTTGVVLQGLIITPQGFIPTTEPNCPVECLARGDTTRVDASLQDYGPPEDAPRDAVVDAPAPDAAPDGAAADAGPTDAKPGEVIDSGAADLASSGEAGPTDGGASADSRGISPAGVAPHGIAITEEGGQLFVSSAGAGFISAVSADPATGAFKSYERIPLSDGEWTGRIGLSPPTRRSGRFLYTIAADRSVRVISVEEKRECETNVDLAEIKAAADGGLPLDTARCFVIGEPGTPPRRISEPRTGIRFGARLVQNLAFVTARLDGGSATLTVTDAGPAAAPLHGVFVMVAISDGTVYVIDLEDWNFVPPADAGTAPSIPVLHLPHRFRNAQQGTVAGTADAGITSVSGGGTEGAGTPVVVSGLNDSKELPGRGVALRAIGESVQTQWSLVYEDRLLGRWSGKLDATAAGLRLEDRGANFCTAGVLGRQATGGRPARHGDIVILVGCKDDDECGLEQICKKPVTKETEYGLCIESSRETELFGKCRDFLLGEREYLVTRSTQDELALDVLPAASQKVIRCAGAGCPAACSDNTDCPSHFLCALADRTVAGRTDLSVKQGECFRLGCSSTTDCETDQHCVAPLDGSPKICAPVPLPLVKGPSCSTNSDCQPPKSGKQGLGCERDSDCADARLECRKASTAAAGKTCVGRQMVCATGVGNSDWRNRCVAKSPCFRELLRYDVRAGRTFIIGGYSRVIPDPLSKECVEDPTQSPLLANRIPVGLPIYPAALGPQCQSAAGATAAPVALPQPNPCFERSDGMQYMGFSDFSGGEEQVTDPLNNEITKGKAATIVRYANPDISFSVGLSHLGRRDFTAVLSSANSTARNDAGVSPSTVTPMPSRGLTIELAMNSGFARMRSNTISTLSLPAWLVAGPDGYVYVVDMGDRTGSTGTWGQVVRFQPGGFTLDNFLVK